VGAELLPTHCHRSLIADALLARRLTVLHITSMGSPSMHRLTRGARADGTHVTYPSRGVSWGWLIPDRGAAAGSR